jgi:hypothetical protein
MKVKKIKLSHPHMRRIDNSNLVDEKAYRVEQVSDSVDVNPGQLLAKVDVEEMCQSDKWQVTIVVNTER